MVDKLKFYIRKYNEADSAGKDRILKLMHIEIEKRVVEKMEKEYKYDRLKTKMKISSSFGT